MNPLVILSGGKDALLARETFVTDLYIYSYFEKGCRKKCTRQSCVGDFKCTVFQRNLKESYGRPLIYVCEC